MDNRKELISHIECVYKDTFKTVLFTTEHMYLVVTRVNVLTTKLWIDHVNSIIKQMPKCKHEPIKRISWLVQQKQYRRDLLAELLAPPSKD